MSLYQDAAAQVIENVDPNDPSQINNMNNGKLIHVKGKVNLSSDLRDGEFDIKINCLSLTRSVQMFQWIETKTVYNKNESNERTDYTYTKGWSSKLVNSDSFYKKDKKNPKSFPI